MMTNARRIEMTTVHINTHADERQFEYLPSNGFCFGYITWRAANNGK